VRSSASYLNFLYPFVSYTESSSCLRLLPRFLIPAIFPSVICFRGQFLCKMWPIQPSLFLLYRIFHLFLCM
jgi:hypothetical protein